MNEENKVTRRQVVAGLGTALAAAAVSPAFAANGLHLKNADGPVKISDPTTLHSKPPFKSQPQPWPGLQSKMGALPRASGTSKTP